MEIDSSYSNYMYDFVDTICEKFGPRYSCSEAERKANEWIRGELDKFCDKTFIDEFYTRPAMYPQGLIKVAATFGVLSPIFIPFKFPIPFFSAIFIGLAVWVLYSELMLMKGWIWLFFKKKKSSNVFGIIYPSEQVKFRLIFEGHTDSAREMNIANYSPKKRKCIAIIGIYYLIHTFIFSIWKFMVSILNSGIYFIYEYYLFSWTIVDLIYFFSLILIFPFFIWTLKGFLGKTVVLGANDNLSASAVAIALGKFLSQNRPKNIEVWVGSQGSEEVGDRGAEAFVEKYGSLGILDDSYTVVLECCGAAEEMFLIEKDMHRAIYDKEINHLLQKAHAKVKADNPNLVNMRSGSLKVGACDACRYIHKGYKASALMGMEHIKNKAVNWHSLNDIPQNISKTTLKDFLVVCLKFVELVENNYEKFNSKIKNEKN
ncbi:MAG: M28 family peptidase [Candidatus Hodarchaeota archaeon]